MTGRAYVFGLVLLAIAAAPAHADIYGFIDENGNAHFADRKVDSRYKLYMKTPPPAPAATAEAPAEPPAAVGRVAVRTPKARAHYADLIARVAREQQVDPALLHAVVTVESAYNPHARSPKGATGLMQLMPDTAKRYGVTDLVNPTENLRAGAMYLRDLAAKFDNNLRLLLAANHAGVGAVARSGNRIPPYPETRAYVPRVLKHYESYRTQYRSS